MNRRRGWRSDELIIRVGFAAFNVTLRPTRRIVPCVLAAARITTIGTRENFAEPTVTTVANRHRRTGMTTELHNDTIEWAARWIEDSLKGETSERVVEFGKNMAMTFRAALLQQPTASERCVECGHLDLSGGVGDGRCRALVWNKDGSRTRCSCACVLATTGPTDVKLNYANAIKLLRELRETTDPDEIARQKKSWAALEADLRGATASRDAGAGRQCHICGGVNGEHVYEMHRPGFTTSRDAQPSTVTPGGGAEDGEGHVCPFCNEEGFDLIGLKSHLQHGDCEKFENLERLWRPW